MKKNFIKISGGIVLVIVLVLIYTAAVTQTSRVAKNPDKKITATVAEEGSIDIGEPTGDDPWDELDKLVKTYYVKSGVSYQGTMKLFDANSDSDSLLEEKKFEYTCFSDEYSYSLSPFEVISKKNYTVIVNHDDKLVALVPKVTKKIKNKDLFDMTDFRKLIEEQQANVKVTQLGNEKILTIDSLQDPDIQGYRIYYSPHSYKISKMLIGMARLSPLVDESNDSEKKTNEVTDEAATNADEDEIDEYYYYLEIDYSVITPLSLQQGEFNPENKFVKITGKKIELTSEFKEYELFNSEEP